MNALSTMVVGCEHCARKYRYELQTNRVWIFQSCIAPSLEATSILFRYVAGCKTCEAVNPGSKPSLHVIAGIQKVQNIGGV
jgi:hypothetical protein